MQTTKQTNAERAAAEIESHLKRGFHGIRMMVSQIDKVIAKSTKSDILIALGDKATGVRAEYLAAKVYMKAVSDLTDDDLEGGM